MKRFFILGLAAVLSLLLVLSGCADSVADDFSPHQDPSEKTEYGAVSDNENASLDTSQDSGSTGQRPAENNSAEPITLSPAIAGKPMDADIRAVNRLMNNNSDEVEVYFVKPKEKNGKSDGFIFCYRDEVFLIDGGSNESSAGSAIDYLLNLRRELLQQNRLNVEDTKEKLNIHVMLSHFHSDHMGAYIGQILLSRYISVLDVYCTEDSAFTTSKYVDSDRDTAYCELSSYGDIKWRDRFISLLSENHPWANVYYVPFGTCTEISSSDGQMTFKLYAPSEDWGSGLISDAASPLSRIAVDYYGFIPKTEETTDTNAATGLPTAIVNANSMWIKVTYGESSMLFTGDVLKKKDDYFNGDEPFDKMLSYYGYKEFDVDLVKFPHHGVYRDRATNGVVNMMKPSIIIFTSAEHTVDRQTNAFWKSYQGVWYCTENGLTFVMSKKEIRLSADAVAA